MIRLTEAQLHKLVKESVNKVLRESKDDYDYSGYYNHGYDVDFEDMNDEGMPLSDEQIAQLINSMKRTRPYYPFTFKEYKNICGKYDAYPIGFYVTKLLERVRIARYRGDGMKGFVDDIDDLVEQLSDITVDMD